VGTGGPAWVVIAGAIAVTVGLIAPAGAQPAPAPTGPPPGDTTTTAPAAGEVTTTSTGSPTTVGGSGSGTTVPVGTGPATTSPDPGSGVTPGTGEDPGAEGAPGGDGAAADALSPAAAIPPPPPGPAPLTPGSVAAAAALAAVPTAPAATTVLLDSGGWSWFEDERVVVDAASARLYVSAVAASPIPGEVVVGQIDLRTGDRRSVSLGAAELDDHNSAAIWEAASGEVLTAWARHGIDRIIRSHRRRTDGSWLRLPPVVESWTVTYNNLYSVLAGDGQALLYDFYRGDRFDPQAMASVDAGRTWSALGSVLRDPADSTSERPYVRYASRGNRIDLIATETHPRSGRTSIYHGFIRDGVLHTSAGVPLGRVGSAVPVTSLTLVATPGAAQAAWTVDIGYDPATGRPIAAYSTTIGVGDHRYHVARWDGVTWQAREIAFGGRALYGGESHYTGLMALDPRDGGRVVISTDADPVTGQALVSGSDGRRHWELFDGRRQPDGAYVWTPLTANSTRDNIRPVMTANGRGASALAWMRGTYRTYNDFQLEVVGVVRRADGTTLATRPPGPRLPVVRGIATPAVSSTRAVPLAGDFDAHPADDLFMHRGGSGRDDLVIGDDGRRPVFAEARGVDKTGYRPVPGDYDGDRDTDILWYAPGPAADTVWMAQPDGRFVSRPVPAINGTYTPLPGDFDGDGDGDVLWYAAGPTAESLWLSQGGTFTSRPTSQVAGTYTPTVGDFDGDRDTDVLWYAPGDAIDYLWTAVGATFRTRPAPPVSRRYTPVPGDFDGDGDGDVLWYAAGTATDYLWSAQGGTFRSTVAPAVGGTYTPVALDHDGNGDDDVVWYGTGSTADYVWWSGPAPFARSTPGPLPL
jgi:hypothetical protein